MERVQQIIEAVKKPDPAVGNRAQEHLDNLTKPLGSLGRLEELARELCVMRGTTELSQPKPAVAVFAADHGAALAGVSAYPREVTAQMVLNFLAGGAGINVLARQVEAVVRVVDVGVDHEFEDLPGLVKAKVAPGTQDMGQGPAMTRQQAVEAMLVGARQAQELIDQGRDLLIPGEMGIGNTTASSAIAAVFTGQPPDKVTGRGTGVDDEGFERKVAYLKKALEVNRPDPADPLGVLAAVGGLEIAAICGYCLMAASRRVPVVLDGLISTAGGMVAARLAPEAVAYFFAGHASVEQGQRLMLADMGLTPILDLGLRLGEGTGAALAVNILRAAVAIYNEMATFESAGVTGH